MGPMRARHVAAVMAVQLLAASVFGASAGATGVPAQLSETESQALVRVDVRTAFDGFVAPPGAVRSPTDPAGTGWELAAPFDWPQDALLYGWWVMPGSPDEAISWVQAHPPTGAGPAVVQREPSWARLPSSVGFEWAEVPGARGPVTLGVSIMSLPGGGTGLRVSAEGFWLRPRPASEVIPAGMRRLAITALLRGPPGRGSRRPQARLRQPPVIVTDPARIERVVSLLNALPLVQPLRGAAPPCPSLVYEVVLRLAFYSGAHAPPTAVVRDEGGGACSGGLLLELAGHGEPRLEPGIDLPKQISAAIGRKLDLTPVVTRPAGR